jgi:type IV pilus assembly protein PilO
MALNIDMKNLPVYVKAIISFLPAVILSLLVVILLIMPKHKEIKKLEARIDKQNNEIAASQAKAAKLDVLMKENEKLLAKLNKLKEQLPDEKEISSLLKEISDRSIDAGLTIKSWKPGARTTHPSGIVYVIPVAVEVSGKYHSLGMFLSNLTKLNRIVNISTMSLGSPQKTKGENLLKVSFNASTFTAVPEAEIKTPADAKKAEVKK